MKYVRTKDGIYQSVFFKIGADSKTGEEYLTGKDTKIHALNNKIIKQADTIEELCDEFVLDHPLFANNCKCLYHSFEKAKNGIKKRSGDAHDLYDFVIYGSIWIDGDLIKVAKMNDKGELELL